MTNTGSRTVSLEELAPWDDADTLEHGEEQITEEDIRELAAYGFDSDSRTLVGLGPVERARRARKAAEILDSQRMPQSQPPGPFIAADLDLDLDDEMVRSLRGRRLGSWLMAVPVALVVAAAAVAVALGFAHQGPPASKPTAAAHALQAAASLPPKLDTVSTEPVKQDSISANEPAETEPLPEPRADAPRSSTVTVTVPSVAAAPPVTLPEQPPPTRNEMLPATADASVGSLNVTSSPPANVLLDGRPLGKAPRLVQVPPGLHTVLFIHPLYGRRSLSVNVSAGQTANASADF